MFDAWTMLSIVCGGGVGEWAGCFGARVLSLFKSIVHNPVTWSGALDDFCAVVFYTPSVIFKDGSAVMIA